MMVQDSNDAVTSQLLTEETTTVTHKLTTSIETLTSAPQSIPTLPFDLVAEILCRLPVNLLLQLRYLCKSFNSLISDYDFAKKQLRMSAARHHLIVRSQSNLRGLCLLDSPLPSVFSTSRVTLKQTELNYPVSLNNGCRLKVCSCDGILCINTTSPHERSAILWNPSFRNFKILPPLEFEWEYGTAPPIYSFGYDHFIDSYKIIVVSSAYWKTEKIEVGVHSLGTNDWRRIHEIPISGKILESGIFVSGTINWLVFDISNWSSGLATIVSLDLEKESYRMLPQPDLEWHTWKNSLGMLRDCLCIFDGSDDMFFDVWIMKEYGNRESWTKLYRVPPMRNHITKVLYMSEDDQMLVDYNDSGVAVYDYKNGTFLNILKIENLNWWLMNPKVYVESLISP
ncbi:F-box/kelch-repeat protein At3g23880-like [Trifolium pratense]|uniref:F-box/kelch-repeat protein At3g23880-like n=1 Tax=Trifolium pratense TaxID=57577 RepID=UPI001E697FC3|nr:F-box/kelch-repeat protein At3g23880-like [Trifolium pratense]